ncbi:type II CRISPR RNA-guided endonuclease Cas9 [Formosa sp. PL04]|uniref:type II CRISPR RNA-guided endonuclease Cas9 n=1 Tax=Formosa sp. PL04 TaxID=3081755 RepID=UPI002980F688|nr:type II CRISPR RNA-guided endonuclease Cas9 [Formosa sp. PL04]MDW5287621.1 type II CRISPR RNA-guided endonuclease Cas9 [Formosa sp. PL04]
MSKILGLDLGTNSIGWAVVEKGDTEFSLIDKGVRIFSEGVKTEKGIESSRAAERTGFRSARKLKYRRKLRKYETLKVLSKNGMCPLSVDEVKEWKKSGFKNYPLNPEFLKWLRTSEDSNTNPYAFRDRASKQKVSLFELGRALYHISQRRGFLSNRLDQSAEGIFEEHCPQIQNQIEDLNSPDAILQELKDYFQNVGILDDSNKTGFIKDLDEGEKKLRTLYNSLKAIINKNRTDFEKCNDELIARLNKKEDLGKVKGKIKEISQAMADGNYKTLGQYFYSLYNKERIRNQYTSREEHYLEEFVIICKAQGLQDINESEKLPEKRFSGLVRDLYRAIFFQRPLKSQKGLLGKCSFEKNKSRCAVSHPDFEEYRMWTYLNTIKIGRQSEKVMRFLTHDEKMLIIPKFLRKKVHFNFEDLAKELIEKGASFGFYKSSKRNDYHYWFNYRPTDTVSGCPVSASLKTIFGDEWKTKTYIYKTYNSKNQEVNRTVNYTDLWHLLSVSTSDAYLYDFAKEKLKLNERTSKAFSKINLKKDFSGLSLNAITKITPYLKQGLLYSHAVFMANIEKVVDKEIWGNEKERLNIQHGIAKIIENHTFENVRLGIINSIIKDSKENNYFYSQESKPLYEKQLNDILVPFYNRFKIEDSVNKEIIRSETYNLFIKQLKVYKYAKIKRLDEKVIDFILGNNEDGQIYCANEKQLTNLYHPSDIDVFKKKLIKDENGNEKVVLGSPITASIKNPMAMRALHQLRKVLNTLILEDLIDEKTIIHIEMARELNNANKRKAIQDYQNENKKKREDAIKEIKKLYLEENHKDVEPTEDDILRYQLWIEQDKKEIYEEGNCIGVSQIIGSNPDFDIEHTIPRSISQDNSQMNKTLCSKAFNRDIKGSKMPFELVNHLEILPRIAHWKKEAENYAKEIEIITRSIKSVATKEAKDKKIRRRHYLNLKRNYLQEKYDRFILEEPKAGFKNSQIPDTGIITRYAQAYLKSYFKRVESVKGGMVAEFRKQWGIQESYIDKNGFKQYKPKDRSSHTHHTIDAITIACMTKDKYDVLANAWKLEDEQNKKEAKAIIEVAKPWKTFKEDLEKLEEEILVSHYTPDKLKKQSKKIVRLRGKKQYVAEIERDINGKAIAKTDSKGKTIYKLDNEGNRIPRYQEGDTVRGSLHQDSIYGAIKDPLNNDDIRYVIRKDLESLSKNDVENIIDEVVREKIKQAIVEKTLVFSSNAQQKNKLTEIVWMNKEKHVPIKKVRVYSNSVKNPLEIKKHSLLSKSRHEHKQMVYGQNDENYCMAIYELSGKKDFELINNFDVSKLIKQDQGFYPLFKSKEIKGNMVDMTIAKSNNRDVVLKKGQQVVFYERDTETPKDITEILDFRNRIYIIEGLSINRVTRKSGKVDEYGDIKLRYYKEARKADDIKKDKFKPDGTFKLNEEKPLRKMNHNQFSAFIEGIDFKVLPTGKFEKI